MKKMILLITILIMSLAGLSEAGERKSLEVDGLWKGYKGEAYYNYWYGPGRETVTRRGIVSGEELKRPMGEYKMKGYFGGFKVKPDGSIYTWNYSTDDY